MRRRPGPAAAFTLIEILVALAVFVIGMVSVVYLLVLAAASQSRAQDAGRVAHLVDTVLAEVSADPRFVVGNRWPAGEDSWQQFREHPEYPGYEFQLLVHDSDPVTRRTAVEVIVRYKQRSIEKEESHRALLLRKITPRTGGSR